MSDAVIGSLGAVYDRGYRPYDGPRGGRRAARNALYRATIRRALGFRRPWRQKFAPFTLLAIATVPAIVNVGVGYLTRNTPARDFEFITYRDYLGVSTALLLFVAITAPDVLCPDRRNRVLPLIFARPLTGADYVIAKLGALTTVLFAFGFLPQMVLFIGQMFVSDSSLDYLRDNAAVLWQIPIAVALLSIYQASLGLALASLTTRRVIGGASLLGLLLISTTISSILVGDGGEPNSGSLAGLLDLVVIPLYLRDLIFLGHMDDRLGLGGVDGAGPLAILVYLLVVGVSLGVLFRRYQWVET